MPRAVGFFGCDAKGVAEEGRNARCTHDLLCLFRKRAHRRDDIDDLEARLPALSNGFLAGDQHHRHAAKKSVSGAGDEVERAGTERRECDPRLSREPPIRGCHESCRLLMTGYDQLDGGPAKAFDDIEVLLTGYGVDSIDALVLEGSHEQIRSLHVRPLLYIRDSREIPEEFRLMRVDIRYQTASCQIYATTR